MRRTGIQSAAENAGEDQDVVDLIGKIRTAGADNPGAGGFSHIGHDFWSRIGQGKNHWIVIHRTDHLLIDNVRRGNADENIGADQSVGKTSRKAVGIGEPGNFFFDRIVGVFLGDNAAGVANCDVVKPISQHKLGDGNSRRAAAADDDAIFSRCCVFDAKPADNRCENNDGCAVLIVVKDGNVEFFFEFCFDFKTARRGNVFQINAAEGRCEAHDGFDDFVGIFRIQADGKSVHIAEIFKQNGFSFHDGHGRLRPDVSETENCCAVGDHGDEVAFGGVAISFFVISRDGKTRLGDARCIGGA